MKTSRIAGLLLVIIVLFSCSDQKGSEKILPENFSEQVNQLPDLLSIVKLKDGNQLSYKEYGKFDGTPVLYFHGFPGSFRDVELFTNREELEILKIRLIAINRPGYSYSEGVDNRTLEDWSNNISELADSLMLDRFSILAYSGGAPFAYVCGKNMAERINKMVIVSGMTSIEAPEAHKGTAMTIPKAPGLILKGMDKMLKQKPEKFEANMRKGFPEVDQHVLDNTDVGSAMMATISEGMRFSFKGAYQDAIIYKNPWNFELSDVNVQVYLFHGGLDKNVKIESVDYMISKLPNVTPIIYSEEGHLSLIVNYKKEILKSLVD